MSFYQGHKKELPTCVVQIGNFCTINSRLTKCRRELLLSCKEFEDVS